MPGQGVGFSPKIFLCPYRYTPWLEDAPFSCSRCCNGTECTSLSRYRCVLPFLGTPPLPQLEPLCLPRPTRAVNTPEQRIGLSAAPLLRSNGTQRHKNKGISAIYI